MYTHSPHWLQLPALSSEPFLGRVHTQKRHSTLLSPCTPTPCALPRCPGSRARNTLPKSHPGFHPQDPGQVATQRILELSQEAHRVLWPPRPRADPSLQVVDAWDRSGRVILTESMRSEGPSRAFPCCRRECGPGQGTEGPRHRPGSTASRVLRAP